MVTASRAATAGGTSARGPWFCRFRRSLDGMHRGFEDGTIMESRSLDLEVCFPEFQASIFSSMLECSLVCGF